MKTFTIHKTVQRVKVGTSVVVLNGGYGSRFADGYEGKIVNKPLVPIDPLLGPYDDAAVFIKLKAKRGFKDSNKIVGLFPNCTLKIINS